MTILSFDVAKDELVGVRADKNGVEKEYFSLPNTPEDIDRLFASFQERYPSIVAGSEATAEYHRPLVASALQRNISFRLINPILTKQFTRATVRKRKTDHTDAGIIAKLLARGEGTLMTKDLFSPVKSLHRSANSINQLKKTLSAISAHLVDIGAEVYGDTTIIAQSITLLEKSVEQLRMNAQKHVDQTLKKLLMTIPGIGETIAATMILEIGDITRFGDAKKLVAYAGLDPKVKQSGKSLHHNTQITKRGSPYLRQCAYIAAYIAARHDTEMKLYFETKRNEGKRYKEAVVACARKILNRVYAVWKRMTPYVPMAQKEGADMAQGSPHISSIDPGAFCEYVFLDKSQKNKKCAVQTTMSGAMTEMREEEYSHINT